MIECNFKYFALKNYCERYSKSYYEIFLLRFKYKGLCPSHFCFNIKLLEKWLYNKMSWIFTAQLWVGYFVMIGQRDVRFKPMEAKHRASHGKAQ